jgi:methylmalonyl-CoA/ethylmalonyl-CoA epimerase
MLITACSLQNGGKMFDYIHHVRILVHDADEMARYIEENFGLTPEKIQVYEARGMKNAIYKVGQTNVEFTEPLDMNSAMGQYLTTFGPGPYHMAFGVSGIEEKAAELSARGNEMRGENGLSRSAEGYLTANIAAASGLGFPFQLAEG